MKGTQWLSDLLHSVRTGMVSVEDAMEQLRNLPYEDINFAKIDHHRGVRRGFPEAVFCERKTTEQVVEILKRLSQRNSVVLGTRASKEVFQAVKAEIPHAQYHETARMIVVRSPEASAEQEVDDSKYILVVTAGTADIPVAEEAAVTAEAMGSCVKKVYDIGVAGIHRLFDQKHFLDNANVIIVVAGMEGALASVVGGLVNKPVIAVPTSVGYGASFQGLAALLTMLNTCAEGVVVVNIDNGFGAGYFAHMINK
jgi:NCAIR mutase (PurE)-related protein